MAKQDNNIQKGRIANLIFYEWKGKQCMRSKPAKVVRTNASVKSGKNFGKASKICKTIRELIKSINPTKNDIQTMFRFTGALNKFINWKEKQIQLTGDPLTGLPFLKDFQFNEQADVSFLRVSAILISPGNLEIQLPAFTPNLSVPYFKTATKILCKMILTGTDLDKMESEEYGSAELEIPTSGKEFQPQVLTMRTAVEKNKMMILFLALQYFGGTQDSLNMLTDKKKLPFGIAMAFLS